MRLLVHVMLVLQYDAGVNSNLAWLRSYVICRPAKNAPHGPNSTQSTTKTPPPQYHHTQNNMEDVVAALIEEAASDSDPDTSAVIIAAITQMQQQMALLRITPACASGLHTNVGLNYYLK